MSTTLQEPQVKQTRSTSRQQPQEQQPPRELTLREQISAAIAGNTNLATETAKLNRLRREEQEIQSEFNGLKQATAIEVSNLAATILEGGELTEQEAVEVKLSVLSKRLEAYRQAIETQKKIVDTAFSSACNEVEDLLRPEYLTRRDRVIAAIRELETANLSFGEFRDVLSGFRVRNSFAFYGTQQIEQTIQMLDQSIVKKFQKQ